jgi:hypothetical protein
VPPGRLSTGEGTCCCVLQQHVLLCGACACMRVCVQLHSTVYMSQFPQHHRLPAVLTTFGNQIDTRQSQDIHGHDGPVVMCMRRSLLTYWPATKHEQNMTQQYSTVDWRT